MRIEESLVELAGNGVNMHLASAHALGVVSLNDLRPEHTSGAELSELHEIIGRDAHIELDAAAHFNGGDTGFGHHGHPLSTPSEGITEFLSNISSGIVEHKAIYGEAAEIIDILYDLEEFLTDFSGILGELDAMAEESLEGVIIDRTAERLSSAGILDELNELSSDFDSATGAARDINFHLAEVDILKDNGEVGSLNLLGERDAESLDATIQDKEGMLVHLLGGVTRHSLAYQPIIVVTSATEVGELTRHRVESRKPFEIFTAIERLNIKAFICAPHQFTVEIGALEVGSYLRDPLISGNGRKHVEQFFFFFCHFKALYLVLV